MVERINFLEKGKYVLTYKRIIQYGVVWVILLVSIFLMLLEYSWVSDKRIAGSKSYLEKLSAKKKQTETLVEASKFKHVGSTVKKLSEIYTNFPMWSEVMKDLSKSMPRQLWLKSVVSSFLSEGSMYRRVDIEGHGLSMASIAVFVEMLNKQPLFRNVVLSQSSRTEEGLRPGYSFVLSGELKFGKKLWN